MWPKICIPYTYTSSAPYEWLAMARGGPRDAPGKRRRVARWWKDTFSRPVDIVQYWSISYEHHEQCFDNRNWCQILSIKSIMSLYILRALDMTTDFKKLKLLKMQWQTRIVNDSFQVFSSLHPMTGFRLGCLGHRPVVPRESRETEDSSAWWELDKKDAPIDIVYCVESEKLC